MVGPHPKSSCRPPGTLTENTKDKIHYVAIRDRQMSGKNKLTENPPSNNNHENLHHTSHMINGRQLNCAHWLSV